ncbi:MAG TPA: hypothetical protein VFD49_09365, partial [Candidatus Dormibacteraeota bacterium]|nr:hypothetical protein [Candidatus Dormibacteraeota bacterium]
MSASPSAAREVGLALSPQARLIVVTSLIGWTLANMDQSFFTWAYPYVQKDFHIGLSQVSIIYL